MKGKINNRILYIVLPICFTFVTALILVLTCLCSHLLPNIYKMPTIENVHLDMTDREDWVVLPGEWEYFYDKWIVTDNIVDAVPDGTLNMPDVWTGKTTNDGRVLSRDGYGSFRLIVENVKPGLEILVSYKGTETELTLPSDITQINQYAFYHCTGLTSITIPDSVTSISNYAFRGCTGLTDIYYTGDIAGWCGISGLGNLMSSSRTLYIGKNKVEGELVIPDSVTSIGNAAFAYCRGLTSVTIGSGVTRIGNYAFYNCTGLTSINYSGTKAQWKSFAKESNWKYNVPTSCKIICSDGTLSI